MTNERWLKWAIARHYRSLNYKVSMKPARAGNAMVDGVALGPEGERLLSHKEMEKVLDELYTLALNVTHELWGPLPVVPKPIRP